MAKPDNVSRCGDWYDVNLAALSWREACRSSNLLGGSIFCFYHLIPRIFSIRMRSGMLIPAEITLIWPLDADEIEVPKPVAELDFQHQITVELPELSGENASAFLAGPTGTTFIELCHVKSDQGFAGHAYSFFSNLANPRGTLRTVLEWNAAPLHRPAEYRVQRVRGSFRDAYAAHLATLAKLPGKPLAMTVPQLLQRAQEDHRVLSEHYFRRGLYVPAAEADMDRLLERKGLRLADDDPEE